MPLVIGNDSGLPKRCFTYTNPNHIKFTFCVTWLEYPAFVWRLNKPDPGPDQRVEIEGVSAAVLNNLEIVDTISWLSARLTPELRAAFADSISQSLNAIQRDLPAGLSLSADA